jgi:hypothetical protein
MAARTTLARQRKHTGSTFADLCGVLMDTMTVVRLRLASAAIAGPTRARLGMLGVPLAIAASLIAGLWWTGLPLAVCAWAWAPRDTGWEWVSAVGRGFIGAAWALLGSNAIARFPHDRLFVGALWSLGAGLLGVGGVALSHKLHFRALAAPGHSTAVQMRRVVVPSARRRFAMHLAHQTTRERRH